MTRPAQILFWFTLAALVAVLSGCVGPRPKMTDAARQQHQMNAPDASRWPSVQNRAMTLSVVPVQPMTTLTLAWEQSPVGAGQRSPNGWEVQSSTNLLNWSLDFYVLNYQEHSMTSIVSSASSACVWRLRAY